MALISALRSACDSMALSRGWWAAFGSAGGTSSSDSSSALMSSFTAGSFLICWVCCVWVLGGAGLGGAVQRVVLDRVPDRGVGGALAVIAAAAFHHFEEHAAHGGGVEVQELAVGVPVEKQVELLQGGQESGFQVEPGVQVLVVVGRDLQEFQAALPGGPGGGHQVLHGEGDVFLVGLAGLVPGLLD